MKIPPVKGTRDFYPQQMAVRNFIAEGWKDASLRSGFEEYDGPIFEYLKMYQVKSGDEIAEQLFSLTDRGGRELAIRPEITPTLARMVNQKINSLPKPVKWFSVPRLCRAERPQKGRLREFFQWNIDIITEEKDLCADAEVIYTAVDYLRSVGLTPNDVKVKMSSRELLAAVLKDIGIESEKIEKLYSLLDKKARLPAKTFEALLAEQVEDDAKQNKIKDFMAITRYSELKKFTGGSEEIERAFDDIGEVNRLLGVMGIGDYCQFDPTIVRGLAYYTGVVFEIQDVAGNLRAICGGGRYDNLLKDFGGPQVAATGMGMGDCVLEILLEQKGLLKSKVKKLDYFIASAIPALACDKTMEVAAKLREKGYCADISYKFLSLGKQLKLASANNAKWCVILGDELRDKQLVIKNMADGTQKLIDENNFFAQLENKSK